MFLYFISKKKWLNDNPKFIRWYWERYKEEKRKGTAKENSFYENWLRILYLEAFNNKYSHPHFHPQDVRSILALAPYLNGGLFKRNDLDNLSFHIDDSLFENVFNYYEKYNFTIREELPLDVEVAVDPQMIGYVYESLSNVAEEIYERQDLGIFYTPTVEVDFMCRRTVVEYLAGHIPELPKEWIYKLLFDEDKKDVAALITKKNLWYRLEELLDNIAVVDPACGSGAFLVGMLHVLFELYRLIYSHIHREITEFGLKKKIIGKSLYGVDVMPWAVHSAELRLWLQLIIEENIPLGQRKIHPLLPNLNLRLRAGDSLVQEIGGENINLRDSEYFPALKRKLTSLRSEKEKYYNNDDTAKFKSEASFIHEEIRTFGSILDDKIISLQKSIISLAGTRNPNMQFKMFEGSGERKPKQGIFFEDEIKAKEKEIEYLQDTKRKIQAPEQKPFIWEIDFAEIFGEKGGFDIVIGNPPYVRQEKIAPPNKLKSEITPEEKKKYKDKLYKSIKAHYPFINKLDKKSDLYIYFYFHGLALLNNKGTFCFITSNSWLDVGYGKDLQAFLLKYYHIKAIYDNEAKRSFEHADVNTIIALFGSPQISKEGNDWPALKETARFVMFKKPFEESINTKNLLDIEKTESVRKTEAYRVYPVKQEALLEEGWEKSEEGNHEPEKTHTNKTKKIKKYIQKTYIKGKFQTGKYEGNKWGGKYLRAPDIFFTIIEKGEGKLIKLGDIAEVKRGVTTGANEFFYLNEERIKEWKIEEAFLKPVIKSPRECKSILIRPEDLRYNIFVCNKERHELKGTNALKYIEWGEQSRKNDEGKEIGQFHKRPSCKGRSKWYECPDIAGNIFWGKEIRERIGVFITNEPMYADCRLYFANADNLVGAALNSTLTAFFSEIAARNLGGGGGPRSLMVYEVQDILILSPDILSKRQKVLKSCFDNLMKSEIKSIFVELGINSARPIREQKPNPLPDRKALDDIVFDILGLTESERNEVYLAVCELVKNRLDKARSLERHGK
jgi:hypothetical protein